MDRFANQAFEAIAGGPTLGVPLKPPTPFGITENTLASARTLATRVEGLVERLLGGVPTAGNPASEVARPSGCLHQLADEAIRTEKHLAEASAALDRLDAVLP